jgi:hypothetical protein
MWMDAMRMIIVAALLMMALLGAVVGSVGSERPLWVSAPDDSSGPRSQDVSGQPVPGSYDRS